MEFRKNLGLEKTDADPLKIEILEIFSKLNFNIDSLSNLNFTPKPIDKPAVVNQNVPAILKEEKIPIFVNPESTTRPHEIQKSDSNNFFVPLFPFKLRNQKS